MLDNMIFDRTEADVKAGDSSWTATWLQGTLGASGQQLNSTTRCRSSGFQQFSSVGGLVGIFVPEGWKMSGRRYTSAAASGFDQTFPSGWIHGSYLLQMPPGRYYRFVLAKEDDTTLTPAVAATAGVTFTVFNGRGRYNCTDLNRVGEAINSVSARLYADGYGEPVTLRTDFTATDDERIGALSGIVDAVKMIRGCLGGFEDTPNAPESIRFLDYNGANAIEKILYDADLLIDRLENARFFAGDLYCGEV